MLMLQRTTQALRLGVGFDRTPTLHILEEQTAFAQFGIIRILLKKIFSRRKRLGILQSDENGERFSLNWFDGDTTPTNLDDILGREQPKKTSNKENYESDQENTQ